MLCTLVTATSMRYETATPLTRFDIEGGNVLLKENRVCVDRFSSHVSDSTGELGGHEQHSTVSGSYMEIC